MTTFTIKAGDTSPSFPLTAQDSDGAAVDCSGASGRFHLVRLDATTATVDASATQVSGPAGTWRYDWQTGDTDAPGVYLAELEVTYSDATVETFPNGEPLVVEIVEALA